MGPYQIILADDHVLLRQGLINILEKAPDLKVVAEAGDGLELLHLLNRFTPNMVILDISMPNLRGIEAIHEIRMIHNQTKILILTMHKDKEYLYQAMSSGADGYLLKEDADQQLFAAIDKIRQGKKYVSPRLSEALTEGWTTKWQENHQPFGKSDGLTGREREVIKLIAEGKSSKEIADLLCISVRTVEHHRANMMLKLNMKKTAELVRYAIQKGFI